jgi:hypothetical protein
MDSLSFYLGQNLGRVKVRPWAISLAARSPWHTVGVNVIRVRSGATCGPLPAPLACRPRRWYAPIGVGRGQALRRQSRRRSA